MTLQLPTTLAALLLGSQVLLAQSNGETADKAANPVTIVSRAEALMRKGEKEDASLMLWQALDLLRGKKLGPIEAATRLSARFLLKENDSLEEERRAAFTAVALHQVAVGKSYRIKKWYDTARRRLDVAALYDSDAIGKERVTLEAKAKSSKGKPRKVPTAVVKAEQVNNLGRKMVARVDGSWRNVDGELESRQHAGDDEVEPRHWQWTTKLGHAENEVTVEFRALDPGGAYNFGLGLAVDPEELVGGFRLVLQHFKDTNTVHLRILRIDGMTVTTVAEGRVAIGKTVSGYHRIAAQVHQDSISYQLDGHKPVVVKGTAGATGLVSLMVGMSGTTSTAIRFRNLTVGPLPVDAPTDEELRQRAVEKRQHAISTAVEEAKGLLASRQKELAARRLRDALFEIRGLPVGVLRSNLGKSIEAMLTKADALAKKRRIAAKNCAKVLGELADKYVADKRARMGARLAHLALQFDPDGQKERVAAAEKAVDDWNMAQLTVRAAELAAPSDDGAMLRDWFSGGRLLDSRTMQWVVKGPVARLEKASDTSSMLMPVKGELMSGTASVHVRLPMKGCQAGFCFDAAGPHDFSVAMLGRHPKQLVVHVARWAGGKWINLSTKKIPIDAWRLEAWHQLTLEVAPTGIKLKALGVELALDRKQLGDANGRIGLYAANVTSPQATVEIRAFQVKPQVQLK